MNATRSERHTKIEHLKNRRATLRALLLYGRDADFTNIERELDRIAAQLRELQNQIGMGVTA